MDFPWKPFCPFSMVMGVHVHSIKDYIPDSIADWCALVAKLSNELTGVVLQKHGIKIKSEFFCIFPLHFTVS